MQKAPLERLKDRLREHGQTYKIDELCLDELYLGQLSTDLTRAIEKCVNVEYITLQKCDLTALTLLPRLPKLQHLDLDDNKLPDSAIPQIANAYPTLNHLTIRNNLLTSLNTLESLAVCKNLSHLEIAGNQVAASPDYRSKLFAKLPQLEIIDGMNQSGNQVVFSMEDDEDSQMSGSESGESESEQEERESPSKMKKIG